MEEGWRAHVVRLEIVSMGVLSLRHFILKYFRTVLFCYPQNHSFVIKKKKKDKQKRSYLMEVGYHVLDYFRGIHG